MVAAPIKPYKANKTLVKYADQGGSVEDLLNDTGAGSGGGQRQPSVYEDELNMKDGCYDNPAAGWRSVGAQKPAADPSAQVDHYRMQQHAAWQSQPGGPKAPQARGAGQAAGKGRPAGGKRGPQKKEPVSVHRPCCLNRACLLAQACAWALQ